MRRNFLLVGTLLVAALVVGAGVVAAVGLDGSAADRGRSVNVQATGSASAQPDQATVRVAVTATAGDATTARERLARNTSRVRSALADIVDDDRIMTTGYDLREVTEKRTARAEKTAAGTTTHYRGRHSIAVEVDDLDRVGPVIDAAVANGASTVDGVSVGLSTERRRQLEADALSDAMSNAHGKAASLAGAANLSLDGVRSAATSDGGYQPYTRMASGGASGDASTAVRSGPVSVTVRVDVVYNASVA